MLWVRTDDNWALLQADLQARVREGHIVRRWVGTEEACGSLLPEFGLQAAGELNTALCWGPCDLQPPVVRGWGEIICQ